MRDAAVDLLLGGRCVGCLSPGRLLCSQCRSRLPTPGAHYRPVAPPAGLAACYASGPYDDLLRALIVGHKEHRLLGLTSVLGGLLAHAVAAALADQAVRGPVVLVPVPPRPGSTRRRGHDPLGAVVRAAQQTLARSMVTSGREMYVAPLLRSRGGVADQSGLAAWARRANVVGSMAARPRAMVSVARRTPTAHVIVCDDVLTTGSTAGEAQRALTAVGVRVLAVATVAATPLRARSPQVLGESSGPTLPPLGPTV